MNIGIDVDGIVACFDRGFTDLIINVTGRDLFPTKPYIPPCWEWCAALGYTEAEESATWQAVKESPDFWQKLDPYPDTLSILATLEEMENRDGHAVYFITNRMGLWPKLQTQIFLQQNGYEEPTVLVSAHKGLCAAALELDLYIDDKPSNCEDVLKQRGSKTKTFILDRPWNQELNHPDITRVTRVFDMLREVPGGVAA